MAAAPSVGWMTSPVPLTTRRWSRSTAMSMASRRRRLRSVRQSLASSVAARGTLPWKSLRRASKRSSRAKASAADLVGVALHDHLAERHLAVTADGHAAVAADGQDRRGVYAGHGILLRGVRGREPVGGARQGTDNKRPRPRVWSGLPALLIIV